MRTRVTTIIASTCAILLLVTAVGYTQAPSRMPSSSADYYDMPVEGVATLMGKKLFRGITNVATGWGEIPRQLVLTTQHEGALGIPLGFFKGVMMTAVRTAAGAAEIALFLAPTPGFYDPLLSPGLVWEHAAAMDASPPAQPPAEDADDY